MICYGYVKFSSHLLNNSGEEVLVKIVSWSVTMLLGILYSLWICCRNIFTTFCAITDVSRSQISIFRISIPNHKDHIFPLSPSPQFGKPSMKYMGMWLYDFCGTSKGYKRPAYNTLSSLFLWKYSHGLSTMVLFPHTRRKEVLFSSLAIGLCLWMCTLLRGMPLNYYLLSQFISLPNVNPFIIIYIIPNALLR